MDLLPPELWALIGRLATELPYLLHSYHVSLCAYPPASWPREPSQLHPPILRTKLALVLTCRRMAALFAPLLYESVQIHNAKDIYTLVTLSRDRDIGPLVRRLDVNSLASKGSVGEPDAPTSVLGELRGFLLACSSLEIICVRDIEPDLRLPVASAVGAICGRTLRKFDWRAEFTMSTPEICSLLTAFRVLRILRLDVVEAGDTGEQSQSSQDDQGALAEVESVFLSSRYPAILKLLAKLPLPALHQVTIEDQNNSLPAMDMRHDFFGKHGRKLTCVYTSPTLPATFFEQCCPALDEFVAYIAFHWFSAIPSTVTRVACVGLGADAQQLTHLFSQLHALPRLKRVRFVSESATSALLLPTMVHLTRAGINSLKFRGVRVEDSRGEEMDVPSATHTQIA